MEEYIFLRESILWLDPQTKPVQGFYIIGETPFGRRGTFRLMQNFSNCTLSGYREIFLTTCSPNSYGLKDRNVVMVQDLKFAEIEDLTLKALIRLRGRLKSSSDRYNGLRKYCNENLVDQLGHL